MEEKKFGLIAKKFVQDFCPVGSTAVIKTKEKGKYGRYLGDLRVSKKWLCAQLLLNHMAVEYHGQSKLDIKEAHLKNRSKIV